MILPHQLDELLIDPAAIELVPESIAREYYVLPVSFADGRLQLLLPETVNDQNDSTLDTLKSVLEPEFIYDTAPRDQLCRFIDLHYWASYSEIENCDFRFRFKCPKQWVDLQPSQEKRVRHCDVCDRDVFFCITKDELQDRASKKQCVAFFNDDEFTMTLGLPNEIPNSPMP